MKRAEFDRKYDHYNSVQKELGLSSVWSIYEIDDLYKEHNLGDNIEVVYVKDQDHWGDKTTSMNVSGNSWAALFVAADDCIRGSGDHHHIYIEQFVRSSISPNVFFLRTGS